MFMHPILYNQYLNKEANRLKNRVIHFIGKYYQIILNKKEKFNKENYQKNTKGNDN